MSEDHNHMTVRDLLEYLSRIPEQERDGLVYLVVPDYQDDDLQDDIHDATHVDISLPSGSVSIHGVH